MDGINLYNQAYHEALINNERETDRWNSYRAEHEELKANLKMYGEQLKVDILIPVGSKALIPGQLYHTGEVMASHGSGYFSDCSIEQANRIIDHRISAANEVLRKYEKERELFMNKVEVPFAEDAFSGKEIIEEYDEAREEVWRREHRIRSRESKLREADERSMGTVSESDQALMDRLEELELMEELEQEMDNLEIPVETDEQLRKLMSGDLKLPTKQRVAHGTAENAVVKLPKDVSGKAVEEIDSEQVEIETTDEEEGSSYETDEEDSSAEFLKLLQDTKAMNKKDKLQAFKNKLNEISVRLQKKNIGVDEKVSLCDLRYEVEEALDFLHPSWENETVETKDSSNSKKTKSIKFAETDSVKFIDDNGEVDTESACPDANDSRKTLELKIVHSPDAGCPVVPTGDDSSIGSPVDIYRLFEHCMRKVEPCASPSVGKKSILKNREMVLEETHLTDPQPIVRKPREKPEVASVDIIGDVVEHKPESVAPLVSANVGQKKVSRFRQQRQ
ncbi:unconventional prefoldin RPB5 interactor-like protein [Aedes albopictus]|uniref:Unconventional prefoldin RPB5 interactor n=1 Tax=Aedes albopictus TaxID=7160 RepID=A0ABM1YZJ4_AEDAL|nr:unconventional prefoldin RPB5 interactor-like protein [Aedes albopictus]XP_029726002.1 unconventional prefoldin RPB5 interactor-like protein [Aedes albopictus]XP_029726003.1 unconventional prefoldin RPB5 interactor-like protein [Aedes albopictus]